MSDLQVRPEEVVCAGGGPAGAVEVLAPRDVPLGGPRAMTVRRTLPRRERSLVGAWCFADHYGPDTVAATGGMVVPGHPHTGLQTVSWLFRGEVEHRDTLGTHALVRPGELNLMTAGRGIAHSEHSTADTSVLHGVQLWVALPDAHRSTAPAFAHHVPPPVAVDGGTARVFLGELGGERSPVPTFTPLLGAELVLGPGAVTALPADPDFEHGVLVDTGEVTVGAGASGATAGPAHLVYLGPGRRSLALTAGPAGARVVLLGGPPLEHDVVMWWNFVGRDHDEIAGFRAAWQRQREGGEPVYGAFPDAWDATLPAPELPRARLRPRRRP